MNDFTAQCGYGNTLILRTDDNYYAVYAHLAAAPTVKQGDRVSRGQVVGIMGNTGMADGVHLHLEAWTRLDEAKVNSGDAKAWWEIFPGESSVPKGKYLPNNVNPVPLFGGKFE